MGGRKQRATETYKAAQGIQNGLARSIDALTEFETFREMFLPEIRAALLKGWDGEKILKHFKPIMAARLVQIGGTGGESAALAAIKEILDRVDGKAIQKTENVHRLGRLPDEELDAVIATKIAKLKQIKEQPIDINCEIVNDKKKERSK